MGRSLDCILLRRIALMKLKALIPFPPYSVVFILLLAAVPALAQRPRVSSLTDAEVEQVREAAIYPIERVNLYTKFLADRAAKIKDLTNRPKTSQRVLKLEDALEDFTAMMDEMGSNLDQYSDRHSDIRKALKPLTEAMPKWLTILRAVPGEMGFDLSRKEAIEAGEGLAGDAERLLKEQEAYFATHKDEKEQERNDDKGNSAPSEPSPKPQDRI
jgi:hypothetical protein